MSSTGGGQRLLLAFDFDWTLVDEDSDQAVLQMLPAVYAKYKELHAAGSYQWTDLMNLLVGEVHAAGVTPDQLRERLSSIPFNPAMGAALELAHRHGSQIIIISDANTFYISTITQAKGIDQWISRTITNTGRIDDSGRLHIMRHTTYPPHGCSRCSANLCKGKELLEHMAEYGPFDRVVYLGDGHNDFCPSTKLSPSDLVLPRSGRGFANMLQDPALRSEIRAEIQLWNSADDVLAIFRRLLLPN
ncbi:phosphatase phospho-type [Entophlyctis helioformis]|nr:phosphatase phospho-type [Entophlyctis helioformis]